MKYSIFTEPPEGFNPTIEVSGCYCEWQQKILLLRRHPERPQGNSWGVPAGKMEKGETTRETVVREVREEVGLDIDKPALKNIGKLYCSLPHVDYIFHLFCISFLKLPEITLQLEESLEIRWVTWQEALELPLIAGGVEALKYYRQEFNQ